MVVRMLKTYTTGYATEILWYLYYIPLLLIPTFYYNCSSYLINSKNKKRRIATIIISTILFLLVITNSLHNIVFKIKSNINDYNHNIGYFIIVAWILCLIVVAIINLIKSSKNKGYKNIISISIIILIGVVYKILYIKNVPVIRKTNMSVIIGTLFCVGLEMMLDFNLIPNNFRYKKIFKNSNLPLEIISQDGKTRIATNHSINLKENIINDIKDNKVKNTYKDNNIVKNVKAISGGYSIEEKDFSKINEYEKELKLIQQELIEQETILQKQRKIATEIYETKLKSEIIELLDVKIEQKRKKWTKILHKRGLELSSSLLKNKGSDYMAGKRTKTRKKIKLNKKLVCTIGVLLLIIAVIFAIIMIFKPVNVGKINKEGKAEYIERVANVTKYPDKKIVEFKNNYELIDNGIITTEIYEKFKNNDNIYNLTVTEYLRLRDISSKESYNINKAIQTGVVKEDTIYADYFAKTCGFENKKELLKYTKAVFELADKEK